MQSRQALEQLKNIDNLIIEYQNELKELESIIATPKLDFSMIKSGNISDPTFKTTNQLEELKGKIKENQSRLISVKYRCLKVINMLSAPHANIIFYYYYRNYTFEKTAALMDISYQWAWELHRRAIKEFDIIYKNLEEEKAGEE